LFVLDKDAQIEFIKGSKGLSVLRERISFLGERYIDEHKILELSQDNKFFKF